jgi:hypothetical protein
VLAGRRERATDGIRVEEAEDSRKTVACVEEDGCVQEGDCRSLARLGTALKKLNAAIGPDIQRCMQPQTKGVGMQPYKPSRPYNIFHKKSNYTLFRHGQTLDIR